MDRRRLRGHEGNAVEGAKEQRPDEPADRSSCREPRHDRDLDVDGERVAREPHPMAVVYRSHCESVT
jgi:hypothetical protein